MPPEHAISIRIAAGVRVYDVSALLPTHATLRYATRAEPVQRLYVHHSGAAGRPGFAGVQASARYVTLQKKWARKGVVIKGFPGFPYHYWIPANDERDVGGARVLYRTQPDETQCWHTGGEANRHGIGVALQGNTTAAPLTEHHVECLEALLPWLAERHGIDLGSDGLSWHSEAGRYGGRSKAACPGKYAVEWLSAYRGAV